MSMHVQNNNPVPPMGSQIRGFSSESFALSKDSVPRLVSKGLDVEGARAILAAETAKKVVLFRNSMTDSDKITMSYKVGDDVRHLRFSIDKLENVSKHIIDAIGVDFRIIVKSEKQRTSIDEIGSFKQFSFPAIGAAAAKEMLKDKKSGTYLFRISSDEGSDGEDKVYTITLKTDRENIFHIRLTEKDGKPLADEDIAEAMDNIEFKYGTSDFLPNTHKPKSARK